MRFYNLQSFITELQKRNDLVVIRAEVDPYLELAEIHRRVIASGGPALLFTNVKGKEFPVVTNLFGTKDRIDLAFGDIPKNFVRSLASLPEELLPPSLSKLWNLRGTLTQGLKIGFRNVSRAPVLEHTLRRLSHLPTITSWEEDGGPFFTLPLVHTKGLSHPSENLGMYRIQVFDDSETGMHFQIGKGGGFHLSEFEAVNQPMPLNLYLGGPPALILSAIAPLPENVPELLLCSLLMGGKLKRTKCADHPLPIVAEAEFCFSGYVPPHVRRPEGPFGDHYGYYSLRHDYPVFRPTRMTHRRNAIFPATVVGKPKQEDFFLGDYLQELLSPMFPLVMPAVKDLWSYGETGYHALSAAVLKVRYEKEGLSTAFRILGEGQLSLTKFLLVIDKILDLKNFTSVLTYILERVRWDKDLYIFSKTSMDTLDYTGPSVNKGSKGVLFGLGEPIRKLPKVWNQQVNHDCIRKVRVFSPGCLVVETVPYEENKKMAQEVSRLVEFAEWPLIVVVDNAERATRSTSSFLWHTFTRFEPASDLYAKESHLDQHRIVYKGPVAIDARMKPWFPKELFCDPVTKDRVTHRWKEYFPDHQMEMGSSDFANLGI